MILTRFLEIVSFIFPSWNLNKLKITLILQRERPKKPVRDDGFVKKIQVGEIC